MSVKKILSQILFLGVVALFFNACSLSFPYLWHKNENVSVQNKLLNAQKKWRKTPYRLGGVSVRGADCSGFTQNVFKNDFGITLARTTAMQMSSGAKVAKKNLRGGDLVFFKTGRGPNGLHVGIYISDNNFLHLSTKGGAKIANLNNTYWKARYIGARRYMR